MKQEIGDQGREVDMGSNEGIFVYHVKAFIRLLDSH